MSAENSGGRGISRGFGAVHGICSEGGMILFFSALAVAAGAAAAFQGAANSGLAGRTSVGNALFVNSAIVFAGSAALWLISGASATPFRGAPWHQQLGGFFGLIILLAAAVVFPRIGGAAATAFMVLGQGLAALAIDRWGLFGMPVTGLTWPRMAGIGCVCLGAVLLRR